MNDTLQLGSAKLRADLISSYREIDGQPFYVIKDPSNGQFFRIRDVEFFIARQLDGIRSLDEIRESVQRKFQAPVESYTLVDFIESLRGYGLLESGGVQPDVAAGSSKQPTADETSLPGDEIPTGDGRKRFNGSLLYLRFRAFDPDRFFAALVRRIGFVFTPQFVAFSAVVMGWGVLTAFANWDEMRQDLSSLYTVQGLLMAWLVILIVGTAHEFAHGLTCKYFGGDVHELGFLLLYFQPALYCNVSEAWLFPERHKRMWVSIAGAYFELFLWAVATLVWHLTNSNTWLSFLSLVVLATSGIKTLFNLNPLLKLDGYYLLSDYLEIPNLRKRSFDYVRRSIGRLLGSRPKDSADEEPTPRERRVFLVYGLTAAVFSFWLLGFFLFKSSSALMQYQGIGLGFVALIFVHRLRRKLGRWIPALSGRSGKLRPIRGTIKWMKRPATAVVILAILSSVLFLGRVELTVTGDATVLPVHHSDVRAAADGIIADVVVEEGTQVRQGELIARLRDWDFRADLRKVEAEIKEKQARLDLLEAGSTKEQIVVARSAVETADTRWKQSEQQYEEAQRLKIERIGKAKIVVAKSEERVGYAKKAVNRYNLNANLYSRKLIEEAEEEAALREKELEEARAELQLVVADDLALTRKELAVTRNEAAEAKGKLDVVMAGNRRQEIEATRAQIALSEAQRQFLEEQISRLNVVSPIAGTVTTAREELRKMVGQRVQQGDLIARVDDIRTITAETAISESDIACVNLGQKVEMRFRSYPQQTFYGTVESVAAAAQPRGASAPDLESATASAPQKESKFLVANAVDNSPLQLKPDMTGKARIFCGKHTIFDLMKRRLTRTLRYDFWSLW